MMDDENTPRTPRDDPETVRHLVRDSGPSSGSTPTAPAATPGGPEVEVGPPAPGAPDGVVDHDGVSISLWGATASGKSTYLAALATACQQQVGGVRWSVAAMDDPSTEYLIRIGEAMTSRLELPGATQTPETVRWALHELPGEDERPGKRIHLEMTDRAGSDFELAPDELVDEMAQADGFVYLLDPMQEFDQAGSFAFFHRPIVRLKRRMHEEGRLVAGLLPQQLSVVISKFDSAPLFDLATRGYWVTQDDEHPHLPRVEDGDGDGAGHGDARGFFEWLCDLYGDAATLRAMRDLVAVSFHPSRTRYFVSSAVGFRLTGEDGGFDAADHSNIRVGEDDSVGLLSAPHPLNVLEPITAVERTPTRTSAP